MGLSTDDQVWNHPTFSKKRHRLLEGDLAETFLAKVLDLASSHALLSDEHFTVDETLIEVWAGQRSFPKRGKVSKTKSDYPDNPTVSFPEEKRTNDTHQSTTGAEAQLWRKGEGKESKLSFMGHVLKENRHGLVVATRDTQATGLAERGAAEEMIRSIKGKSPLHVTLGGDKNYDTGDFVSQMREFGVTPHVAQNNTNRKSAIDVRTTRHLECEIRQRKRKILEEGFGWLKTIALLLKTGHKGVARG